MPWVRFALLLAFMMAADRLIPLNVRRFGGSFFKTSSAEFFRRYGLVSFPRTLFCLSVPLMVVVHYYARLTNEQAGLIAVFLAIIYGVTQGLDIFNARK